MVPTPSEILAAVTAVAGAASRYFEWLMTPEGKAFSQKAMADRNAWDKFWSDAANAIGKLFRGELFKSN